MRTSNVISRDITFRSTGYGQSTSVLWMAKTIESLNWLNSANAKAKDCCYELPVYTDTGMAVAKDIFNNISKGQLDTRVERKAYGKEGEYRSFTYNFIDTATDKEVASVQFMLYIVDGKHITARVNVGIDEGQLDKAGLEEYSKNVRNVDVDINQGAKNIFSYIHDHV